MLSGAAKRHRGATRQRHALLGLAVDQHAARAAEVAHPPLAFATEDGDVGNRNPVVLDLQLAGSVAADAEGGREPAALLPAGGGPADGDGRVGAFHRL